MKKYMVLAYIMLLCFLCACNKPKDDASDAPAINCENGYDNYVISADNGYYLLCGNLIAYWDGKLEHKARPLCNRLECDHISDDCVSFIPTLSYQKKIFYVDGYLYLFSGFPQQDPVTHSEAYNLWKVAADGSSKEIVLSTKQLPVMYTVLQRDVYYEVRTEEENGKSICSVFSQPLEGGEEKLIWKSQLQNGGLSSLQGIGENLYIQEYGVEASVDLNDPDFNREELKEEENIYVYQPETGELKEDTLYQNKKWRGTALRNFFEGKLYYSYHNSATENELWCRDIQNGAEAEAKCVGSLPTNVCTVDSKFFYSARGGSEAKVFDYEGNVVLKIPMSSEDVLEWVPGTAEYVFGHYEKAVENEMGIEHSIFILERDKLADGTAEMITLIQR